MMWLASWANQEDYDCMSDDPGDVSELANPRGIIVKELTPETIEKVKKMAHDEWADMEQDEDNSLVLTWAPVIDTDKCKEWEVRRNGELYGSLIIRDAYEL